MEFLGVGPGELILVLVLALVVIGPDRLPGFARQAGKMLVTVRDWVQRSPDAAMILRARSEIESELATLRASLAEVQSARDEVVQAARQVNSLVADDIVNPTKAVIEEVRSIPRSTKPNGLPAQPQAAATAAAEAPAAAGTPALAEAAPGELVAADGSPLNDVQQAIDLVASDGTPLSEPVAEEPAPSIAPPRPAASEPETSELRILQSQIEALTASLQQLQAELQERGVINPAPLVQIPAEPAQPPA